MVQLVADACPDALGEGDNNGWLPLHSAAAASPASLEVVQFLAIARPGTLLAQSNDGCLPLHLAVRHAPWMWSSSSPTRVPMPSSRETTTARFHCTWRPRTQRSRRSSSSPTSVPKPSTCARATGVVRWRLPPSMRRWTLCTASCEPSRTRCSRDSTTSAFPKGKIHDCVGGTHDSFSAVGLFFLFLPATACLQVRNARTRDVNESWSSWI